MSNDAKHNADRFTGFSDIYDQARPAIPEKSIKYILQYLQKKPETVVDLGCGTGLSTTAWQGHCTRTIGVEPSPDMLKLAQQKQTADIIFAHGFGHEIPLADESADIVVCSQSFHWMEPATTLDEVNRILHKNGIFATVDCDWPPTCQWEAEKAYQVLFDRINAIEREEQKGLNPFTKWPKKKHLENIQKSSHFRFAREIVFNQKAPCTRERFINLALSQGGLQSILKTHPALIAPHIDLFTETVNTIFTDTKFEIDFGYRMRIAVK